MMLDMKRSLPILGAMVMPLVALLLGCQGPRPAIKDVQIQLSDEAAYRQFWQHTLDSVRHFGYSLDRVDPPAGMVISDPLTSKQWFEFWRNDTLDAAGVTEASLHTIRRQVRVEVHRDAGSPDAYFVTARVSVQRLSQMERQITNSATAARAFTGKAPAVQSSSTSMEMTGFWVDLGRDRTLERAILYRVALYPSAKVILMSDNQDGPVKQPADEDLLDENARAAASEPAEQDHNQ